MSLDDVSAELQGLGKDPGKVKEAIEELKKENAASQKDALVRKEGDGAKNTAPPLSANIFRYSLLLLIIILLAAAVFAVSFFFEQRTSRMIYLISALFLLKAVVYALALYIIIMITEYNRIMHFSRCFLAALIIALAGLIPIFILKYIIVAAMAFIMAVAVFSLKTKASIAFTLLIIFTEIFMGVGFSLLLDMLENPGEVHIVSEKTICIPNKQPNIYNKGYIRTEIGSFMDFCTTHQDLSNIYQVESCSGKDCYVVEYTCTFFQSETRLFSCTAGCEGGACKK